MQGKTNSVSIPTQIKTISLTANGSQTVYPDAGKLLAAVTATVNIPWKGNLTPVFNTWTFGMTNSNRNPSSVTFSGLTVDESYFVVIGHFCAYRTLATANVTGISGGTLISWKTGTTGTEINGIVAVFTANATSVTISLSGGSSNTNWGNQSQTGFTIRV